jgi:hypothetical protein
VLGRLAADAALQTALGTGTVAHAQQDATPSVPGVTWAVTGNWLTDIEEVAFTRWDVRAATLGGVIAIERRLRADLDRRYPEDVGGTEVLLEYVNGQDVCDAPGSGVFQRAVWYRFTVSRDS